MYYQERSQEDLDDLRREFAAEAAHQRYLDFCEQAGWDPDDENSICEYQYID